MNKLVCWFSRYSTLILVILLNPFLSIKMYAQQPERLSIQEIYKQARENYPLIMQRDLIAKTKEYSLANAAKGYLPVFSINGQATYQSEVTSFPFQIQGLSIPEFSKDQYRIYAEANQVIYDGGYIKNQRETAKANEAVQQQNLETELYELYERINQLFFGSLLIDEQLIVNSLFQKDIENGIDRVKALVANGVAYKSNVDELSANLLEAQQARVELITTKKAFLGMLSLFINTELNESIILEKPASPKLTDTVNRPELLALESQKGIYDLKRKMLNSQLKPQVGLFVQGGYGRPGLNLLSDDFAWYYIGGFRLSWNFGSLYTLRNQKNLLDISESSLGIQQETILFNTTISQQQQKADIEKYESLIQKDKVIIRLRVSVKKAAYAQLENGVISVRDYMSQVNAEDQARQNMILHEVLLLQAQYKYRHIMGSIDGE